MESIGIIAEYNPFHNGHVYQIQKIKEKYPDSILVLILSGNYTQRGEVAIIDKFKRAEIALQAGIDLIVELPFPFATQSADYFSYGAITLLEKLKVHKVIFGSESNNIEDLKCIVETQLNNKEFDSLVHIYSKMGNNYPTSLSLALKDLTGKEITTPNDLLGISYLKTIYQNHYSIQAETIKRTNSYHEDTLTGAISSGSAIRKGIKEGKNIKEYIPKYELPYLKDFHFIEDYFPYLKYKILTTKDLSIYQTVEEGIEHVIQKEILTCTSYEELISHIKTKRYTENKIKRMLLHILLNFTKEKAASMKEISYIRLLGFSNKGRKYLNRIKKEIDIPIISKVSKNKDKMLEEEIETSKIYYLTSQNYQTMIQEEYENHLNKGEKSYD